MKAINNIYKVFIGKLMLSMVTLLIVGAFSACTDIDENDRLIYVKPSEVKKHVLIEDFTGQRCVNCPNAAEKIKELQELYGEENIIAVGIYGGDFGYTPVAQGHTPLSLTTEEGNSYYTTWGVKAQPSGMIDRYGGKPLTNLTYWTAFVNGLINQEPTVMITPSTSYNESSKTLKVHVEVSSLKTLNGAKLQVWLVEDNIKDMQYMPDGSINNDYIHEHVFRASINNKDGEAIDVVNEQSVSKEYTIQLDSKWKSENMSVITFVFTADGVQQTEKTPVINNK